MKTKTVVKQSRTMPDGGFISDKEKPSKNGEKKGPIHITQINTAITTFYLVGTTPIVFNRLGHVKATSESPANGPLLDLLDPPPKKTKADKQANVKHNPPLEFRNSIHRMPEGHETFLGFPASGPKRSMANIATDMAGVSKAQIGRLVHVHADDEDSNLICVWGLPKLFMANVRNSDMNHTPDVHTLAKIRHWAMRIRVEYPPDLITTTSIVNLLIAAGRFIGQGDGRPEKGKLRNGCFRIILESEKDDIKEILAVGRKQQIRAMEAEEPYDDNSASLLSAWIERQRIKGRKVSLNEKIV